MRFQIASRSVSYFAGPNFAVKETVERVNDLLNAQNRANLAGTLANARGLIEENRPQVKSALQHVNDGAEKLGPVLQDFRKTSDEANQALGRIDSMLGENRADVRKAVIELRRTLTNMTDITARLDQTLDVNSENIDEPSLLRFMPMKYYLY
jgi:ABC-type transporter Mla subunit MlaD